MSPMGWFREYLIAKTPGAVWDAREDFAVRVCMRFANAEKLAQHVVFCADAFIRNGACTPGNAKTLFFALEQTGDDKYRQAIQLVMERLDAQGDPADAPLSALCETLPFRMAYEMKLNRMERVGQTAAAYRSAHQRLWDKALQRHRVPLREEVWFLLALIDGIAACSDQLYEHWRTLVDIYRETLRGVLAVLSDADTHTLAILLWALLRGVELGLIDPERYLPAAAKGMSALRDHGEVGAADMLQEVFGGIA